MFRKAEYAGNIILGPVQDLHYYSNASKFHISNIIILLYQSHSMHAYAYSQFHTMHFEEILSMKKNIWVYIHATVPFSYMCILSFL